LVFFFFSVFLRMKPFQEFYKYNVLYNKRIPGMWI
jgi:hypothetical protein